MNNEALIVVNFGGPRCLGEIRVFLEELLTDRDVVRTRLPVWIHEFLFKRIAKKRADTIAHDYQKIGGKSPIFEDTEWMVDALQKKLSLPVLGFHRYLPDTHPNFLKSIRELQADSFTVFPLFPQFTYATTGSIARWFANHIPSTILDKMQWIASYPTHPKYIEVFSSVIRDFLVEKQIPEEKAILLFSAHGLPKRFIEEGDVYQKECEASFEAIATSFPNAISILGYQSQFGKDPWIGPSTQSLCESVSSWIQNRFYVVIVPLSFTSDHIETLFEIEYQYIPILKKAGIAAYRCPALNRRKDWVDTVAAIIEKGQRCEGNTLIRK